jgi:serine/threonine protein kinase
MTETRKPPVIPNYRIIEKLGEGGMASVWLAQRSQSMQLSVIKILHSHLSADRIVQSRFLREAQVAALLDHPNIARLYDASVSEDTSYLAMEFIPGTDVESMMLKVWEQKQVPPPELSITLTLQMLEGLHYAHELQDADGKHLEIVHRDLSPRNVMLTFDGEVKIIDFGLARINLGDFRTAPGMIAGTLRYMSPEQATADAIDRRTDVYTWAVVLYELLTGKSVVAGREARAILGSVVVDVPPPLSSQNPNLPKALDAVLAKALEKDRENRFKTAEDFRVALAMAAGELGVVSKDRIGAFLAALFPEQQALAARRLELTMEIPSGPALEPTRFGAPTRGTDDFLREPPPDAPELFEPTRFDRPAHRTRKSSKAAYVLGAVALTLGAAALLLNRPTQTTVTESPPAQKATAPDPIVAPVVVRTDSSSQTAAEVKSPAIRAKTKERSRTTQSAPPKRARPEDLPRDLDAEIQALESALSKLGKRGDEIAARCGAGKVIVKLGRPTDAELTRILDECRSAMDE